MCNVRMTFEICPGFSLGSMVHSENITTKTNLDALIIRITVPNCRGSLSQWPRVLRHRSAAARLQGLWVRITPGTWMFVSCECCVLSGRGLCVGLITRSEEYYRLWCVWVWLWIPDNEEALAHWGRCAMGEKKTVEKYSCTDAYEYEIGTPIQGSYWISRICASEINTCKLLL